MLTVNFYSAQVKYSGRFEDHSKDEFFAMAQAKQDKGVDCFDRAFDYPEADAELLDGQVDVYDMYPSNKIARVDWSYIAEQEDEDDV